jgi:site-specific recombinase XerD
LLDDYIESLKKAQEPAQPAAAIVQIDTHPIEPPNELSTTPPAVASTLDPGLIANAGEAFLDSCKTNGVKPPTISKYRNVVNQVAKWAATDEISRKKDIRKVADFTVSDLDRYRASRKLAPITSSKELETLRQFWEFCTARDLCLKNIAAAIKGPKIVDQNDVVPYTPEEMQAIMGACRTFGRGQYERKRGLAAVLTLRHVSLRIGDIALLRKDRISQTKKGWRILVRTIKNNALVFLKIPNELVEALLALPPPRGSDANCPYFFWNGKSKPKSQISEVSETLAAIFRKSGVSDAGAHRYRHTVATELLGLGATFVQVADVLGNSAKIVEKHYAKWSVKRQEGIDDLIERVHADAWQSSSKKKAKKRAK